jgi:hypothetical protein
MAQSPKNSQLDREFRFSFFKKAKMAATHYAKFEMTSNNFESTILKKTQMTPDRRISEGDMASIDNRKALFSVSHYSFKGLLSP